VVPGSNHLGSEPPNLRGHISSALACRARVRRHIPLRNKHLAERWVLHGWRPGINGTSADVNGSRPDVDVWGPDVSELRPDINVWGPDKNGSRPDINVWRSDMNGSISDIMICFLDHDSALAPTNSLRTSRSDGSGSRLGAGALGGESPGGCQPASENASSRTRSRCHESTYGHPPNTGGWFRRRGFGEGHICAVPAEM
jgi:hypothetical protein